MRDSYQGVLHPDEGFPETWQAVADGPIKKLYYCEFELAEEVIGLLELEDGTYVVGIGETLRPYLQPYRGEDREVARLQFELEVRKRGAEFTTKWED